MSLMVVLYYLIFIVSVSKARGTIKNSQFKSFPQYYKAYVYVWYV